MDGNMIIVGYFNIPFSPVDIFTRQSISEVIKAVNSEELGLMNLYSVLYPPIVLYSFFSRANGTFSRKDHYQSTVSQR